ncbi:8-oxo-dGTP pyrophosphatase MutT (NUDIX family) [Marmoricola sp. OAE513]|uniref:NUDIX hydrolase n=1 Tax=Marmoricola sp. OAE513 TaxID=2817894 RepID=UPI001DD908BB
MTPDDIAARLLTADQANAMDASGRVDAAVLIPLYWDGDEPVVVFTERHADLRKHAGEISFPGGRQDPAEVLQHTALREAHEEIGLDPDDVRVLGALPPLGTFVSNFSIYPYVGALSPTTGPAARAWRLSEREVAQVLEFRLSDLAAAHQLERLWSKGVPVRTSTFRMGEHLIWGATARILHDFLRRVGSLRA